MKNQQLIIKKIKLLARFLKNSNLNYESKIIKKISENLSGTVIVVDVQPEYENYIGFDIAEMLDDLIDNYSKILFLYNGADTVGHIDEYGLKQFYFDKLDWDEDRANKLIGKSTFFDKGYGFFRDIMDSDLCFAYSDIVALARYMINTDIHDIRDLSEDDVDKLNIDELLFEDLEDYGFNIPELNDIIANWNGSSIMGGGKNECLAEVEILADARDLVFNRIEKFTF